METQNIIQLDKQMKIYLLNAIKNEYIEKSVLTEWLANNGMDKFKRLSVQEAQKILKDLESGVLDI